MLDAFSQIYKKEGIRGLYKGTSASIVLTAPEAAIRFGAYQFLNNNVSRIRSLFKKSLDNDSDEESSTIGMLQSSVNGALSGIVAKTLVYPFDLIKKRLQIQGFEEGRVKFGQVSLVVCQTNEK